MKIDPRIQAPSDLQNEAVKNAKGSVARPQAETKSGGANAASSGDTFQLSSRHSEVQHLTAQVAQVPEVRADKVAALQAKVSNNSYKPDSGKVADALLAEHTRKAAQA
jgi:flagellar biosynthesis anti-sigma factor FlgM